MFKKYSLFFLCTALTLHSNPAGMRLAPEFPRLPTWPHEHSVKAYFWTICAYCTDICTAQPSQLAWLMQQHPVCAEVFGDQLFNRAFPNPLNISIKNLETVLASPLVIQRLFHICRTPSIFTQIMDKYPPAAVQFIEPVVRHMNSGCGTPPWALLEIMVAITKIKPDAAVVFYRPALDALIDIQQGGRKYRRSSASDNSYENCTKIIKAYTAGFEK